MTTELFTFDFETKGIQPRPHYPPIPVGVAIKAARAKSLYLPWGHPEGNLPGASSAAAAALCANWRKPLLCHNAAFDIAVAHEMLGMPLPEGSQINDTMFLAFLLDPYGELGLKPLAEEHLGMLPTERDRVRDYLYTNRIIKRNVKRWGAFISEAPGDLVGEYAVGDVDRTKFLFDHLAPMVKDQGMWEAYRRECDIVPMLLDNSAQGIPLDRERLITDTAETEQILKDVHNMLRLRWSVDIGGNPPDNFDSGDELAQCLQSNKRIVLPKTPTGRVSTAKDALMEAIPDCKVKGLLLYRSALSQCLQTYMRPWLEQGEAMHCNWNQVRDFSDKGARTGRLSSSPNLQNITNPEKYAEMVAYMTRLGFTAKLPNLRSYIIAPQGMVLYSRDYSQQELRLLAHFEDIESGDGVLAQAYRDDPDMDVHEFVQHLMKIETRKPAKTINFGKIYGMGAPKLSRDLKIPLNDAYALMRAYDTALPSVKALQDGVNEHAKSGSYITTLGKRRYYSPQEERDDKFNTVRTFEYKVLNYLIQGSAADQTKEAMRLWWQHTLKSGTDNRFLLTVHDQLVGCCPMEHAKAHSEILDMWMRKAFSLKVPVKTDPTYGYNFGEMAKELPRRTK